MAAIFWKEVKSYFYSPIAYILIGLFIIINSFIFRNNLLYGYADFSGNISFMSVLLVFIIPILTMKILAEDRKTGTEVLLITSPASLYSIVVGKYLATLFVFIVMTVITFIYPIVLIAYGAPLTIQLVGGFIGFILLGAAVISIGIFASSLTENQVIAAVISFISLLIIMFLRDMASSFGGVASKILNWFSLYSRYDDFSKGVLSVSSIVYYISFIAVFLFITVRIIEKRRWSQG